MNDPIAPDFELPSSEGSQFRLASAQGRKLVLYFYPKDSTPGCTTEAQQFRDLFAQFQAAGCDIYGISRDSVKSHQNFKAKHHLPFLLLSDSDESVCTQFGVIKMKNMYGRQVRGIERSTFVLDRSGLIIREWRGVKLAGHAQQVLEFVSGID